MAHQFKVGDRVVYMVGTSSEDHGVVKSIDKYGVWCMRDLDDSIWFTYAEDVTPEATNNDAMEQNKVYEAKKLVTSLGYTITKSSGEGK